MNGQIPRTDDDISAECVLAFQWPSGENHEPTFFFDLELRFDRSPGCHGRAIERDRRW